MQPLIRYYIYLNKHVNKQYHTRLLLYSKVIYQRPVLEAFSFS
jgi:hypothetical protein